MNRTDRLYAIVEELRASAPRRRSARELAGHFEVSVRTIERDIVALQQAGVPIYADTGRAGGYTLDKSAPSPDELLPGRGRRRRHRPRPGRRVALRPLRAYRPAQDRGRDVGRGQRRGPQLAERSSSSCPRTSKARAGLRPSVVEEAVAARQVVRLTYRDRNGAETRRDVEPVAFISGPRDWYLIGWCRLREGPRVFRMDRVLRASLLDEAAPTATSATSRRASPTWSRTRSNSAEIRAGTPT